MQVITPTTREARASQRGLPPLTGTVSPGWRNVALPLDVIWSIVVIDPVKNEYP
ncbi:hypothetical protein BJ994_003264 [Arthrobacter pigmenti]|uniref:Uncharacterized protein n=1 Tax=Arthrobacter pigmenti TaxID=271432 RepID=A0A846RLC8_9MICC|nr:hypothetical protein [Arthrobacter pigmenti]